jgi:prevent-host-death family protein
MVTKIRSIAAGRFKAQCLAVLDEVAETGIAVVVTKRGKPVARVVPVEPEKALDLAGSVVREGDLLGPIEASWSADR